ncbi:hypothetical protein [Novosphingobium mangrovi (ex Hu et al. 2023)]|uniref:Pectate lyase superfamily protein domain-containing protein n=1 Tax=Novosphingobium mangrovi (ex Hu et al. 2023) TaxID=2930094 RepID=A0ABT0A8Y0_9SPHN|nr:hypothetical protein [Novosphingobium mangrovi (ex Hu et al. 2023)]MCJ1959643.1 hypothetical protein [Novosphingobium mangrovi (ex Hu et al. 2023)]
MARISQLPVLVSNEVDGTEAIPVVKSGRTVQATSEAIMAPQVAKAEVQANRAELAATQAAVAQSAYDTIEQGLAATADGAVFNVRGSGDTFATSYRNDGGSASAALGAFPSKQYLDGIAPGVLTHQIALDRYAGVQVDNPAADNAQGIMAAVTEAMTMGKTLTLGPRSFHVPSGWATLPIGNTLKVRGEGGRLVGPAIGTEFALLRAPIDIDGVNFDSWGNLFLADQNMDLSEYDVILRNVHARECYAMVFSTREDFRIRRLILENFSNVSELNANGVGQGQGVRWQAANFESILARGFLIRGKNYQGLRLGGYPHSLFRNGDITVEDGIVEKIISNGQSNGVQIFASRQFYANNLVIRNVDCVSGSSSNVEPFYCVGEKGQIGSIFIDNGGNDQGALAIKAGEVTSHGPIEIFTRLHPRMTSAVRIDGDNVELDGLRITWSWEALAKTAGTGAAYTASSKYQDVDYNRANPLFFVPHTVNTSTAPTLDVNGIGALPMVAENNNGPVEIGQLRPGAVYRAIKDPNNARFWVRAINYEANVLPVEVEDNHISLPDETLVNGRVYWFLPRTTMGAGGTMSVGGGAARNIRTNTGGTLSNIGGGSVSNGFPKAVYYSAADDCFILLQGSGKLAQPGRFVPCPVASGDRYDFEHPYPADYADAAFVLFPENNTTTDVRINLDGTERGVLRANGLAMTAGYLAGGAIYRLDRSGEDWLATRVGGTSYGIDCVGGRGGRMIVRNTRFVNTQYQYGIEVDFEGYAEIDGVYGEGKFAFNRVVTFNAPNSSALTTRAVVKNMEIEHFYGDGGTLIRWAAGIGSMEVRNVAPVRVRGQLGTAQGSVIGSIASGPNTAGALKVRNVRAAANYQSLFTYAESFTSIDSDHVTLANVNPPPIAAGASVVLGSTVAVTGLKVGDLVKVHPVDSDLSDVTYSGKCLSDGLATIICRGGAAGGNPPSGQIAISYERRV